MRKTTIAALAVIGSIALIAPAAADTTTTVVKKSTTYETRESDPTIVLTPDGIAVGSIHDTEDCTTKTVKRETDEKTVTKTTKNCR